MRGVVIANTIAAMDTATFARARTLAPEAVATLFEIHYPRLTRLSVSLTGDPSLAQGVLRQLLRRGLARLPRWEHPDEAMRWLNHHVLLGARQVGVREADVTADPLAGPRPQVAYTAFLRAFRSLPHQQREALLLHDCESLDLRATAVAMDCSTTAASTHLSAARAALSQNGGAEYADLAAALRRTYLSLATEEPPLLPVVRRAVRRHLLPRRIKRLAILLIALALGISLYWLHQHGMLIHSSPASSP